MRVNSQAQSSYANIVQTTGPQAPTRKGNLAADAINDISARADKRDRIDLSPEATEKYGLSKLQEHILGKLRAEMEAAGVDFEAATALDWSPDATAHRIVDFATGLMGIFRDQNPELSESELIDKFESTVRGAVDQGYGEAIGILQGLNMDQSVLDTAQTTIDTVHSLFDEFFANLRGELEPQAAVEATK